MLGLGLIALFSVSPTAWCAEVSMGVYTGAAGSSVLTAISFAGRGDSVSAVQLDLEYDSTVMSLVVLNSDGSRDAEKQVFSNDLGTNRKRILLIGLNRTQLADGTLVDVLVNLRAGAPAGAALLKATQVICSDPDGQPVVSAGVDGRIDVQGGSSGTIPIQPQGVVNAASLRPGPVAPGEMITLFGSAIGPANAFTIEGSASATSLGGTNLLVNDIAAPLIYASSEQINAVVPYATSGETAKLTIDVEGRRTAEVTVPLRSAAPAMFTLDASGSGAGAILNEDYSINGPSNPAARGTVVMLYATGGGQTNPPGVDTSGQDGDQLRRLVLPVVVHIGGTAADALYAGTAPGSVPGLLQINARVPVDIEPGSGVPIAIEIGSVRSPNGVTVAVK